MCIIRVTQAGIGPEVTEKKPSPRKKRGPYKKSTLGEDSSSPLRPLSVGILPNLLGL